MVSPAHKFFASLCLFTLFASHYAAADTLIWNNTGTNFNDADSWTNANLLLTSHSPTFTDTVSFDVVAVTDPVVTSGSATAVHGIAFDTLGSGYTLSSATNGFGYTSQLAIGTGGIQANNISGTNTISASLVLNMNESITQAVGGQLNITGPVVLGADGGTTLTIGSPGGGIVNFTPSSVELAGDLTIVLKDAIVTLPAVNLLNAVGTHASLTLTGGGYMTITAGGNYDGGTTITDASLIVTNTTGSATGTGAVVVNGGGTLSGTGIVSGSVTVNGTDGMSDVGRIIGGINGVGTLTLQSNLTFSGTLPGLLVQINGSTSGQLAIGGILDLSDPMDQITFTGTPNGTTTYVLATYGSRVGTFNIVNYLPDGYQLIYGATELDLVPIPEPTTGLGAALAVTAIAYTQRRRLARLLWPPRFARH